MFQAKSSGSGAEISIDEFRLTTGLCGGGDTCTFEPDHCGNAQCTWRNTKDAMVQNAKWISGAGPTGSSGETGPTVDHTTGTPQGTCNCKKICRFKCLLKV